MWQAEQIDRKLARGFEAASRTVLSLACIRIVAVRFSPRRALNDL